MNALADFIARLPKAELHIHLEGAISQALCAELAARHGLTIEGDWSRFEDLTSFLRAYGQVCDTLRRPEDFEIGTHAALARAAACEARYVELFFSPDAHDPAAIGYGDMLDGVIAGARRAERELGVVTRIIPAHNRELGPAEGMAFLERVLEHRRPEVIGIGLDYGERAHPPAPYAEMFAEARRQGLEVTAHAGEDGPAAHVRDSVERLGCRRIDHGYHIVDDPGLVEECRALDVLFTVCPTTTLHTTRWRDLHAPDHAIRRMIDAGLRVTLNTDDPALFATDLNREYLAAAEAFDLSEEDLARIAANGFSHSWTAEGRAAGALADA